MKRKKGYIIIATLLLSITSVMALEEFKSPAGTFMKVESQEELSNLVSGLNPSSTNPIYLILPRPSTTGKCAGFGDATMNVSKNESFNMRSLVPRTGECECGKEYTSGPCCKARGNGCTKPCDCPTCIKNDKGEVTLTYCRDF
jgi:hypothetical protein